jgi:hypothetical protein
VEFFLGIGIALQSFLLESPECIRFLLVPDWCYVFAGGTFLRFFAASSAPAIRFIVFARRLDDFHYRSKTLMSGGLR